MKELSKEDRLKYAYTGIHKALQRIQHRAELSDDDMGQLLQHFQYSKSIFAVLAGVDKDLGLKEGEQTDEPI